MNQYNSNTNINTSNPIDESTTKAFNLNTLNNLNLVNNQNGLNNNNYYNKMNNYFSSYFLNKNILILDKDEDPIKIIENCDNAYIDQPITFLQIASGCITENEFGVYLDKPQGLYFTFYFKEKSNCFCRNCFKSSVMYFDMYANYVPSGKEIEEKVDNHYFAITRMCGCSDRLWFCDCIRPKMKVSFAQGGKHIGTIVDSCACCDDLLQVYDSNDELIYSIRTSCWQIGLCCGRNAETVAKIDFKILDTNGIRVGHIVKVPSSEDKLSQLMVFSRGGHDASNSFNVNFPKGCPPEHKFLLIIAAIKLGYQFFTKNANQCCTTCNRYCCNMCYYYYFPCKHIFSCCPFVTCDCC